jgi:peptidyl-prolyl cis-trans isomerase SurA
MCAILVSLGCAIGASDAKCAQVVDRIVAIVNDDIISFYELNKTVTPYLERIKTFGYPPRKEREMLYRVRQDILDQLINDELTDQEVKRSGITVTEKEIDAAIERVKEARLLTDENLREELEKQGNTYEAYRNHVREQILRARLVNLEVKSKIIVTKTDIRSYYNRNRHKYAGEKKYHLQHVFVKMERYAAESEKARILAKMQKVREKLLAGSTIESVREEHAGSPQALAGGDLGLFGLEELSPLIKAAVTGLHAGEYTPVLETEFGYQIVFVRDIIESPGISLQKASPEIEQILFKEDVDKKFKSWLEKLRKGSHIKIIK